MRETEDDNDIMSGINITPLVDVCLVLVIIFMVTAPLMSDPVLKVTLPKARTREGEEREKITITLSRSGHMALQNKTYANINAMTVDLTELLRLSEGKLVILKADENARYGQMTEIMANAKEAGALSFTIATEQKK